MRQQHGRAYVRSRLLLHLRKYLVAQLAEVSIRRDAHYGGLRADVLPDGERVDEAVNVRSTRVDVVADDFGFDLITSRLLAVIQAVPSTIDGAPRSFLAVLSKTLHLPLY